jgi:hypothetical protein
LVNQIVILREKERQAVENPAKHVDCENFTPDLSFSRARTPRDSHQIVVKTTGATVKPGLSSKSAGFLARGSQGVGFD